MFNCAQRGICLFKWQKDSSLLTSNWLSKSNSHQALKLNANTNKSWRHFSLCVFCATPCNLQYLTASITFQFVASKQCSIPTFLSNNLLNHIWLNTTIKTAPVMYCFLFLLVFCQFHQFFLHMILKARYHHLPPYIMSSPSCVSNSEAE